MVRAYPREAQIAACDVNDLTDKYEIRLKNVVGKKRSSLYLRGIGKR
jgi:hypothetical protein